MIEGNSKNLMSCSEISKVVFDSSDQQSFKLKFTKSMNTFFYKYLCKIDFIE